VPPLRSTDANNNATNKRNYTHVRRQTAQDAQHNASRSALESTDQADDALSDAAKAGDNNGFAKRRQLGSEDYTAKLPIKSGGNSVSSRGKRDEDEPFLKNCLSYSGTSKKDLRSNTCEKLIDFASNNVNINQSLDNLSKDRVWI